MSAAECVFAFPPLRVWRSAQLPHAELAHAAPLGAVPRRAGGADAAGIVAAADLARSERAVRRPPGAHCNAGRDARAVDDAQREHARGVLGARLAARALESVIACAPLADADSALLGVADAPLSACNPGRQGNEIGVYTHQAAAESVTLRRSDVCGDAQVNWRPSRPNELTSNATRMGWLEPGVQHVAVMAGLAPGQRYFYALGDASGGAPQPGGREWSFVTPPAAEPSASLRFVMAADMGVVRHARSARRACDAAACIFAHAACFCCAGGGGRQQLG
jgi:hypothetical protein